MAKVREHVTFRFHDNDFGSAMQHALGMMYEQFPKALHEGKLEDVKEMIIRLMIGYQSAKQWSWGDRYQEQSYADTAKHYYEYFSRSSVSEDPKDATVEHNGEWCTVSYPSLVYLH